MKLNVGLMALAIIFILGACSGADEGESDKNNREGQNESSDIKENVSENDIEEELFTIGNMEVTPFEEVDGKTAVRLSPADWNQPYELNDIRWKMYYGDHEFVMSAPDEGIFRYDLVDNQMKWETVARVTDTEMHNGIFYGLQLGDSNSYANIGTMDIANGNILNYYEEKDHRMAFNLQFIDEDLMLFTSAPIDKEDNSESDLFAYDLQSGSKLWTTPAKAGFGQQIVDIGDSVLLVSDLTHTSFDDQIASAFDKETGEEKFQIVANAIGKSPVVNEEGIYFADHRESSIQLYDFEGNLKEEAHSEIGFSIYQLIEPIATDGAFILADNEGIAWYNPDLSTMQHRVELGESSVRYMEATDDRLYVIVSDKETDEFFVVSLDIKTGEAYEKIALDIVENTVIHPHIYNNKYSFAVSNNEGNLMYYVFSGEDVNKPIE